MADEENTARSQQNKPRGLPLAKGFDPRRNIKGVPKGALLMRKHMRQIAAELIGSGETEMTRLDAMLRQLWTSRNPSHNKLALQVLDPKILTEHTDITSNGETLSNPYANLEPDELIAKIGEMIGKKNGNPGQSADD